MHLLFVAATYTHLSCSEMDTFVPIPLGALSCFLPASLLHNYVVGPSFSIETFLIHLLFTSRAPQIRCDPGLRTDVSEFEALFSSFLLSSSFLVTLAYNLRTILLLSLHYYPYCQPFALPLLPYLPLSLVVPPILHPACQLHGPSTPSACI